MKRSGDQSQDLAEDSVPGKVIAAVDRIARGVRAHRQAVAGGAGITVLQAELLRTLNHGQPPPAFAGPLATELGVSQPTVSDSLAALERKGYIARTETPTDRRRSTFVLTEAGMELASELARSDDALLAAVTRMPESAQEQALGALLEVISGLLGSGVLAVARTCPTCRFFEEQSTGPQCTLLQVALAPGDLRVNCPEHQPTS